MRSRSWLGLMTQVSTWRSFSRLRSRGRISDRVWLMRPSRSRSEFRVSEKTVLSRWLAMLELVRRLWCGDAPPDGVNPASPAGSALRPDEWRGSGAQLVDGAVTVETIAYGCGGKDEGQGCRGQQVIRGEQGTQAAPPGPLPGLMLGPPLEEGGGEAVVIVGSRDGDGLQAAVEDVVIDTVIVDELIQQAAQGALSNRWKAWLLWGLMRPAEP